MNVNIDMNRIDTLQRAAEMELKTATDLELCLVLCVFMLKLKMAGYCIDELPDAAHRLERDGFVTMVPRH